MFGEVFSNLANVVLGKVLYFVDLKQWSYAEWG